MPSFGRLATSYPSVVALVLLALTPFLILTTSLAPLEPVIADDLGTSVRSIGVATAMANAAYAFGSVLSVQLVTRLPPRRMLVLFAALFVLASALAAWSPAPWAFFVGHIAQGMLTGLLLIAAVPPLVLAFPPTKLPSTAVVLNLGIFGAVALGPFIGGVFADSENWRLLFWIAAGVGAGAFLFTLLTYVERPPQDPNIRVDIAALFLAAAGPGAIFFGVSQLPGRRLADPMVLVPLIVGLVLLITLLVEQYEARDPLVPVREFMHTVPIAGIVSAMSAGASAVALIVLVQEVLPKLTDDPLHTGVLLLPLFGTALLSSVLFGVLLLTRYLVLMPLGGLILLAAGGAILTGAADGGDGYVLAASALIGFGVGSSVAPALFMAGFSLRSPILPRVFSLLELLRAVGAFLVAPALAQVAVVSGSSLQDGFRLAAWIAAGVAVLGVIGAGAIIALGGRLPGIPDAQRWMAGEGTALESPSLFAVLRRRVREVAHEE